MAKLAIFLTGAGALGTSPLRFSVSGQSAGGSMAVNHLFAHSASVDGALIAAGSPYGCGMEKDEEDRCYYGNVDIEQSVRWTWGRYAQNLIDDPSNLNKVPVLLFNGKSDECVYTRVMRDTFKTLQYFVDKDYLFRSFNTNAAHVWSLDHGQCHCGACASLYGSLRCCDVNNCHYDLSGDMLRKFYGSIRPRVKAHPRLYHVHQWRYIPWETQNETNETNATKPTGPRRAGLWKFALVYVPTGCEARVLECRIHVNYHGCIRKRLKRRRLWATSIDLNEYAESNDIVVVYPQAAGSPRVGNGCWNWGDSKDDQYFDTRRSMQIGTVMNLLKNLPDALQDAELVDLSKAGRGVL
ncbi:unnamed protein product [Effrenium voratum]|nr:unnamed protein product [Effrenium voratum]